MKVLVACEYSGRVRDAFTKLGHDAMSCDILPTESPGEHYQGDVFDLDFSKFDLMIAHPPCTYLTNAGVTHLHKDAKRWLALFDGAEFFRKLLDAPVPKIAIENPIMHKYAKRLIRRCEAKPSYSSVDVWTHGAKSNMLMVKRVTEFNAY